ncbi:FxSxx-COOH cyclophane-containing RiPP peptide [Streptomyces sp. NPDC057939]|uniref:FxSxx-COOH cyclophane-containing RiPP peptide n=1 Tax=Streptomyces sp. NPDC057939 TaxID=3346284 RepID=UPI0036EEA40B
MSRFRPPCDGKSQWTDRQQGDQQPMVTGRQETAATARPCPGRLPDLSGLDLAALRGIDHPVLAEVIEGMVERVTHPAEILNAFDSGVA